MNREVDLSPDFEWSIALVEQFERIGQLAQGQQPTIAVDRGHDVSCGLTISYPIGDKLAVNIKESSWDKSAANPRRAFDKTGVLLRPQPHASTRRRAPATRQGRSDRRREAPGQKAPANPLAGAPRHHWEADRALHAGGTNSQCTQFPARKDLGRENRELIKG